MIKNLIRDYPEEALEFFNPTIIKRYGKPGKVQFHIQEIKKHSHFDRNLTNDIAVSYTFPSKNRVVLALVEHWSDKAKFDIYRFAHYLIDLVHRFPNAEILPIALFTDREGVWKASPPREIRVTCLDETYLHFRYSLIRMKDHQAEKYRTTKNRFISVLRSAMAWDREKKLALAVEVIKNYGYIENDIKRIEKNLAIIEFFLDVTSGEMDHILQTFDTTKEVRMSIIAKELKKRGFQEGVEQGVQQGMQEGVHRGKVETARAMKKEGIDVAVIARVTGLSAAEVREL